MTAGAGSRAWLAWASARLARIGLVATIILSPFVALTVLARRPSPPVYSSYTDILLTWSEIALIATLVAWLVSLAARPRRVRLGPAFVWLPIAGLLAAAWLGAPFSVDPPLAAWNAAKLTLVVGLFAFVVNEVERLDRVIVPILLVIVIQAAVAIGQVAGQSWLGLSILREWPVSPELPGSSVVIAPDGSRLLRAYGLTAHPNVLGGVLGFALLVVGGALEARGTRRVVVTAIWALGAVALLLTFSRAAWLGTAVGLGLAIAMLWRIRDRAALRGWMGAVLASAIVCAPLIVPFAPWLAARATGFATIPSESRSIDERFALAAESVGVAIERPLLGSGLGTLPTAMQQAVPEFRYPYQPAHLVALVCPCRDGDPRRDLLPRPHPRAVGGHRPDPRALDAAARCGLRRADGRHRRGPVRLLHVEHPGGADLGVARPRAVGGRVPRCRGPPGGAGRAMTRPRVALVVPGFAERRDDPGMAAVVDLVERLAREADVEVVALRHPSARPPYEVAGARVTALGGGAAAGPRGRAGILGRGVVAVLRLHRRRPIDVVHGLWADEPGAVASIAARLIRRPSIVSLMGGELARLDDIGYGAALGRGGRWTAAISLRAADLITAGSGLALESLHRPRHRSRAGAPPARRRPRPVPAGRPTVAGSADDPLRRQPRAGQGPGGGAAGIRGAGEGSARASTADRRRGSLRRALEGLAASMGLGELVRFAGQVPRAELPDLYRSASLLVVTSRHEGQSMVAVEAAASGLPVVGTRVGMLPELGDGAVTVQVGDEAGLLRALAGVLDDPGRQAAMGRAGRAVAVARYDLDRTAADLLARYEALAAGSDPITRGAGGRGRPS